MRFPVGAPPRAPWKRQTAQPVTGGGFWVRFDVALQRYAITNFEVALECLERADSPAREDTMLWGEYSFEALRSE